MVFSSLTFLFFFLPSTLLFVFLSPKKWKNGTLFFFSLLFYAWGEPVYIVLMLISTFIDYFIGLRLEQSEHATQRRIYLLASIISNIGILGFFKYYSFLAHNIELLTGIPLPDWNPPLPIGISFYTFQTLSYTIDVYRRQVTAQRNFISFGCYVALFPQLIAGPIVRYQTIAHQLQNRSITLPDLVDGSRLFLIGLAKKVLLANQIGILWEEVQALPSAQLTTATAWLGIIAFAFQIYFDFSGYSDMARGLGRMLGFTFPINFHYPYIAQSITEFWRRWHITLGTWFREYVYIPLGGNRVGKWRLLRNIFIVWTLTGLWHGASWNFALWGLYFAVLLAVEKFILLQTLKRLPSFIRVMYSFFFILIGWVLFSQESLSEMQRYFAAMLGIEFAYYDTYSLYLASSYFILFLLCIIGSTPIPKHLMLKVKSWNPVLYNSLLSFICIVLFVLSIAYLINTTYNPFLYFRF